MLCEDTFFSFTLISRDDRSKDKGIHGFNIIISICYFPKKNLTTAAHNHNRPTTFSDTHTVNLTFRFLKFQNIHVSLQPVHITVTYGKIRPAVFLSKDC